MTKNKNKSVKTKELDQLEAIQLSQAFFSLQARIQVVQSILGENTLSYDRLCALYKEVNNGDSPKKGLYPSSLERFLSWRGRINSILFLQMHRSYLKKDVKAEWAIYYALLDYLKHPFVMESGDTYSFSVTRSWMLLRFIDSGILAVYTCPKCELPHLKEANMPDSLAGCLVHRAPARIKSQSSKPKKEKMCSEEK